MENSHQVNWRQSRDKVGWVSLKDATPETWEAIGFKCGLEVHQQLLTERKLFCRCRAGIFHDFEKYDAEIVRHMRPTLSELGEYDGTALMEFKTRKKIVYRIKNDSACTYEVDDTPPFPLNREALANAMEVALLLNLNIVGELHITRKQYLDGSIPTGFQRTTILGIEGSFPISTKTIRVIQFSVEEDSCREVSDYRHPRVYYADRLGMPLIETVTYPDMLTPWEAAEAAQSIRFISRSSGKVRVGIGAAREDVNVSVTGGTRIEIKGVAHIKWIPKLTHNEAFRQRSLLLIMEELAERGLKAESWDLSHVMLDRSDWKHLSILRSEEKQDWRLIAVNLPGFCNILSYFNQPGRCFADEIGDRLKVIACLERPNMYYSEELTPTLGEADWQKVKTELTATENDAQILFWAPEEDIKTALDTIRERCQMAFGGVPNETRKSLPNGITYFERVLPGADRMYPDTDSAPISIKDEDIESARKKLPVALATRWEQLKEWQVPRDAYTYILRNNLMPVIEKLSAEFGIPARYLALCYAHVLKGMQGRNDLPFDHERVSDLLRFIRSRDLSPDILPEMLKVLFDHPNMQFASVLETLGYKESDRKELLEQIPLLLQMWHKVIRKGKKRQDAMVNWAMGRLRKAALGNIPLKDLREAITAEAMKEVSHA